MKRSCINFSSGILAVDFFSSVDVSIILLLLFYYNYFFCNKQACISDYAEKLVEIVLFIDKKMNASHFQEALLLLLLLLSLYINANISLLL
jgi:hypothetical protein